MSLAVIVDGMVISVTVKWTPTTYIHSIADYFFLVEITTTTFQHQVTYSKLLIKNGRRWIWQTDAVRMIKINPGAFSMPCYPPIYPDDLMERVGTTMAPPPPPPPGNKIHGSRWWWPHRSLTCLHHRVKHRGDDWITAYFDESATGVGSRRSLGRGVCCWAACVWRDV